MTLEEWSYKTPFETGIGASEGSAIEMAIRLAKRKLNVTAHCPLPKDTPNSYEKVTWLDSRTTKFPKGPCIVINYRAPKYFDRPKPKNQRWWFLAEDVAYDDQWSTQAMKNTDRYLTLCKTHAEYTVARYPLLRKGKVFQTSNGIRTDYIEKLKPKKRDPNRLFYASSPDRGLLVILKNWFRIRERFPKAELRIAYGFNNMNRIIEWQGVNSPLIPVREEILSLGEQKGITWLGRISQDKVFDEWLQATALPYPSAWAETNFCAGQDAMACGAVPVFTNFWAQGEFGSLAPLSYMNDGLPENSELARSIWLSNLYEVLEKSANGDFDKGGKNSPRNQLMTWARKNFDFEKAVDQWMGWIKVDSK